jgi:hypothetical protein
MSHLQETSDVNVICQMQYQVVWSRTHEKWEHSQFATWLSSHPAQQYGFSVQIKAKRKFEASKKFNNSAWFDFVITMCCTEGFIWFVRNVHSNATIQPFRTDLTIIGKICRSKLAWWKYNCILTHRGAAKGTYKVNPNCADVALQVRIILH